MKLECTLVLVLAAFAAFTSDWAWFKRQPDATQEEIVRKTALLKESPLKHGTLIVSGKNIFLVDRLHAGDILTDQCRQKTERLWLARGLTYQQNLEAKIIDPDAVEYKRTLERFRSGCTQ